ncbi:MAG: reverse transcriptase domain-containing protein, partial [Chitinivibrionales bacterium]
LYAGRGSRFFYQRWQDGYGSFSDALRAAFSKGFVFAASFDLTACYDSIDHSVLTYFLEDIGFEKEFCLRLCNYLKHWTASSAQQPIYQGHGIPQGPLPSGLLSEVVLRYFDAHILKNPRVHYFRYVDDIRLLAKSEIDLRHTVISLDMLSKNIGLFPQSSKIEIHRITDIDNEIKSISHPPEIVISPPEPNQAALRKRLRELTQHYTLKNETRFRYILGSALPSIPLARRLLRLLVKYPHLYISISNYLAKFSSLSQSVSTECVKLLKSHDLYASFSAYFIRVLNGRIHSSSVNKLVSLCFIKRKDKDPELRAAVQGTLIFYNKLKWLAIQKAYQDKDWWVRSELIGVLKKDLIGAPSYSFLIHTLLKDKKIDVAITAADALIASDIPAPSPISGVNRMAQVSLKQAGLIGRIKTDQCFIGESFVKILGKRLAFNDWRQILGGNYGMVLKKVVRWKGYFETDATAWVNISDTLNDVLLDNLYKHEKTLGTYSLGNMGCVLA